MAASEDKDNNGMGARYDSGTEEVKFDVESPARNRYKGTLLSERRRSRFPVLFERASHSWWNPRFDSEVLEEQVAKSSFPQTRIRFQYACFYIIASCAAWSIFFAARAEANWVPFVVGTLSLLLITVLVLIFSYTRYYQRFCLPVSIFMSLLLVALTLAKFQNPQNETNMSDVGSFAGVIEILLMMYTVIPMPLFVCVIIGVLFSILYEVLLKIVTGDDEELDSAALIVGKVLLHFCIHIIGLHIFIMSQVRKRSTFWKVGQSIMAKRDLEIEKQLKEKMINSLMPETIAKEVVQSRVDGNSDFQRIIFRPFTMHQMKSVSILFADIVGFTKMSSNKTAEKLVSLLNNLFGRFDKICFKTGCEKICTLGDCYYCVSGCPTPRPDHAKCCIEMGLGMIKAIKEFDEEHNEEVNMRVGVHTGKVLCGVVGTSRFKFDVMSNDVDLANVMESTGEPGRVHISAETLEYLKDLYEVTEGKEEK
ncbi:adenylate cyclase type 9, partial [Lingula anatina]|uniref:adenylate cyclase n=1 Tax=Lingula anatina TaxID=7574 RepID=A0A1S3IGH4_LINAN